jgi:hypothetical protein
MKGQKIHDVPASRAIYSRGIRENRNESVLAK